MKDTFTRTDVDGFPGGSEVKAFACNAGDVGSIPGSGRCPGGGHGYPLQYSFLGDPMDGETWCLGSQRATSLTYLQELILS